MSRSLLLVLIHVLASPPSAATESWAAVDFDVECAKLSEDPEVLAAFEARALVELSLRADRPGTLSVTCDERNATLSWQPRDRVPRSRVVSVPEQGRALVDRLLAELWEVARPEPPTSPPPASPPPKASGGSAEPEPRRSPPGPPTPPPSRAAISGGPIGSFWNEGAIGGAGGRLGLRLRLLRPLSLSAQGSFEWGLESDPDLTLWAVGGLMAGDVQLPLQPSWLELGGGVSAARVRADIAQPFSPEHQTATAISLFARARAVANFWGLRWAVGPELHWNVMRPVVRIDGAPRLEWSQLALALALEVAVPVY